MNEVNENACGCTTCPGADCTCGCQSAAPQGACACGPECRCEGGCKCADAG